jgi:SAM-dependent methyltransferase
MGRYIHGMPVETSPRRETSSTISSGDSRTQGGINYGRLYEYRFRGVDQVKRQAVWSEIARYIHRRLNGPASVLDPAAGRGEFITAVPAADRWAVDAVSHGQSSMPGVKVIISDIMDADLPEAYFDGVFVSNFLEHLADQDSVARFLDKIAEAMAPGGRIAIMGPNFRHCPDRYFDFADHTVILTHLSVAEHLHAAGFNVTQVTAKFLPYSFQGILPPSSLLTRLYLRMPVMWRLLGKQFLVLAEKPAADQPAAAVRPAADDPAGGSPAGQADPS